MKRSQKTIREFRTVKEKLEFDRRLGLRGCVVGIDEAGRGPWAGPVVAAAVSFPPEVDPHRLVGLDDSKKLSPSRREFLAQVIEEVAFATGIGAASPGEIDRLDIEKATFLAMRRALEDIGLAPDLVLVDGRRDPGLGFPTECIVKGDGQSAAIAAASILAKTNRDRYMDLIAGEEDRWGFSKNKGYGTEYHRRALAVFGPGPDHRKTFKPVTTRFFDSAGPSPEFCLLWTRLCGARSEDERREIILEIRTVLPHLETNEAWILSHRIQELEDKSRKGQKTGSRSRKGRFYEEAVVGYLEKKGYTLLERNYRTPSGEIDLIVKDGDCLVFIEIKMRSGSSYGTGVEAVDPLKRKRILRAARHYLAHLEEEVPVRFDVISLDPEDTESRETRLQHFESAFDQTEMEDEW